MKRTTKILIGVGVLGGLVGANMWLRKSKATKAAEKAEEPIKSPAPPQKDLAPNVPTATVNDIGLVIRDRVPVQGSPMAERNERDYERLQYGY